MITDFDVFGPIHILSIVIAIIACIIFIVLGTRAKTTKGRKNITVALGIFLISLRLVRYIFDIAFGMFSISNILSIHICNITLVMLGVLLITGGRYKEQLTANEEQENRWIKVKDIMFSFTFIIGIPAALSTAIFPGSHYPPPGVSRAVFFIMSHTALVMAPLYLVIVEKYRVTKKQLKYALSVVAGLAVIAFVVNTVFEANYLYLMASPDGSILYTIENNLGYAGYLGFLLGTAVVCFLLTYIIGIVLCKILKRK